MNKKFKNNGFTLIEIVIAVALVVALMSIGFYNYGKLQEKSKQKMDASNAAVFADIVAAYISDNEDIKKTSFKSNEDWIGEYFQGDLKGKSKKYKGIFTANLANDGKITVNSSDGEEIYP